MSFTTSQGDKKPTVSIGPNDHQLQSAGNDGTSSLSWSPTSNLLVSGNWDCGVRCWEVQEQAGKVLSNPKAQGNKIELRGIFG
jgi:mRNA export factor